MISFRTPFFVLAIVLSTSAFGQSYQLVDSIEQVYVKGDLNTYQELQTLENLSLRHYDPGKKLLYSQELVKRSKEIDSVPYEVRGLIYLGQTYAAIGNYREAIENYLEASNLAIDHDYTSVLGTIYNSLANVFFYMKNYTSAREYYNKALSVTPPSDSTRYAQGILNLGEVDRLTNQLDSALIRFEASGAYFRALNNERLLAYNIGNEGLVYAQMGESVKAQELINEATKILFEIKAYSAISDYLIPLSDIYLEKGQHETAEAYALQTMGLAREHKLKPQIRDAHQQLSEVYIENKDSARALHHYMLYVQYRDSLIDLPTVQEVADMRTDFEVSQKQLEVDLLEQQKKNERSILYGVSFTLLLALLFYRRISREKNRSDKLLLNILPKSTAEELKSKGVVKARKFDSVTVMFTDFEGFTKYSQDLEPEMLVKSVNDYFSAFDSIIEKHGLEKIKTIGDAYMCTGGLESHRDDHADHVVKAAIEILDYVNSAKDDYASGLARFNIRIGMNTGPVVAGVVGTKKFAYDIWGDTVNVAARMESNSKPGRINVSEITYALIKDKYHCKYRGEIDAKNKGRMKMYFVNGPKDNRD